MAPTPDWRYTGTDDSRRIGVACVVLSCLDLSCGLARRNGLWHLDNGRRDVRYWAPSKVQTVPCYCISQTKLWGSSPEFYRMATSWHAARPPHTWGGKALRKRHQQPTNFFSRGVSFFLPPLPSFVPRRVTRQLAWFGDRGCSTIQQASQESGHRQPFRPNLGVGEHHGPKVGCPSLLSLECRTGTTAAAAATTTRRAAPGRTVPVSHSPPTPDCSVAGEQSHVANKAPSGDCLLWVV